MSNLYGLIGEKLEHSYSPHIHDLILKKTSCQGMYNLFEVRREDLMDAVYGLKALGAKGVNVTIPYKVEITRYLDGLSNEAKKIGAVNTVSFNDNKLIGYNTDYHGFGMLLKKYGIKINNEKAVILGTGGVSRAVIEYLIDNSIRDVVFVSRMPEKTDAFMKNYKIISYENIYSLKDFGIIINCTPCGMHPQTQFTPVNKAVLTNFTAAVDLIYNPETTVFLSNADQLGLKTVNGLYMLVAQAVAAQEIWQSNRINYDIIDEIYQEIKSLFKVI